VAKFLGDDVATTNHRLQSCSPTSTMDRRRRRWLRWLCEWNMIARQNLSMLYKRDSRCAEVGNTRDEI